MLTSIAQQWDRSKMAAIFTNDIIRSVFNEMLSSFDLTCVLRHLCLIWVDGGDGKSILVVIMHYIYQIKLFPQKNKDGNQSWLRKFIFLNAWLC